jgi:hypothetical protein
MFRDCIDIDDQNPDLPQQGVSTRDAIFIVPRPHPSASGTRSQSSVPFDAENRREADPMVVALCLARRFGDAKVANSPKVPLAEALGSGSPFKFSVGFTVPRASVRLSCCK